MTKILPLILPIAVLVSCASQKPFFDEEEWLRRVNAVDPSLLFESNRNDNGIFFNPWMPRHLEQKRGRWSFFRKKMKFEEFPEQQYKPEENDYSYLADPAFNSVSFVGHASFIIKIDGVTILTDPFFSNRALIIGKKVKIPFDYSKLPRHPVVLISHNHYDHLDKKTIKQLVKKEAVFVVPLGLKEFFTRMGASEVHELDWWQSTSVNSLNFVFLPAQHWSRRIGQAANTTLWGSFIIEASKTFYFSGDTGYFCGFREFGKKYNIDYAILGAGAYEPRWFMHYQHMNVAEFFRAANDIGAKTAIPMHFGIISLSDEPLVYPLYEIDLYIQKHPEYAPLIKPLRVGGHFRF